MAINKSVGTTPEGKLKTLYYAHQVKMFGHRNSSVPILCPNIRGHISIVQVGEKETYIRSHCFNPIVDIVTDNEETRSFIIDYKKRVASFENKDELNRQNITLHGAAYKNISEDFYERIHPSREDLPQYVWVICTKPGKRTKEKQENAEFGVYQATLLAK